METNSRPDCIRVTKVSVQKAQQRFLTCHSFHSWRTHTTTRSFGCRFAGHGMRLMTAASDVLAQRFYDLLPEDRQAYFEEEELSIKGKGSMTTFLVPACDLPPL